MRLRALLRPLSSSALTRRALDLCNSIFDIFFNFRTAIYAADGSLVLDTTQVRKSYMRSWFGLDVLACLPVTYVEMVANHLRGDDGGGSGSKVKALKILREPNKCFLCTVAELWPAVRVAAADEDAPSCAREAHLPA